MSRPQRFVVSIRRNIGRPVKPQAEQLDGRVFQFEYGWLMDESDPYPGEVAFIPSDTQYPPDAPAWISSGDLLPLPSGEGE